MTAREQLISYVKNGREKISLLPSDRRGAGFDTKLAGKSWIGDTTLEDTAGPGRCSTWSPSTTSACRTSPSLPPASL